MIQDISQQQENQGPMLDQDTSRAGLAVVTYLMTHLLPQSKMQSQAQPNQQVQQETQAPQGNQAKQQPQEDKTSELKGQMDAMKTEHDAKLKSLVENQQKEIDQLKQMIQQVLEEEPQSNPNEPQPQIPAPTNL